MRYFVRKFTFANIFKKYVHHIFPSSQHSEEGEMEYVNMEGYMEKLPINKKKATLLKTWKRRFFKAEDGVLYYYEVNMHICVVDD